MYVFLRLPFLRVKITSEINIHPYTLLLYRNIDSFSCFRGFTSPEAEFDEAGGPCFPNTRVQYTVHQVDVPYTRVQYTVHQVDIPNTYVQYTVYMVDIPNARVKCTVHRLDVPKPCVQYKIHKVDIPNTCVHIQYTR